MMEESRKRTTRVNTSPDIDVDLQMQHNYLTTSLGGPIPKKVKMSEVHTILDVGCHLGIWAQEVLQRYPDVHITAIDRNNDILARARRIAEAKKLQHITFEQMIPGESLHFKDATFDLIHMRSAGTIPVQFWPALVNEFARVTRPGGWINLVQYDRGLTSSHAFSTIERMGFQLLRMQQTSLSPASDNVGIAARLYGMLLSTYLIDVSYTIHAVDLGYNNTIGARDYINTILATARSFRDAFVQSKLCDAETYDELVRQAREELTAPYACGYAYLISALARKDG